MQPTAMQSAAVAPSALSSLDNNNDSDNNKNSEYK